MGPVENNRDPAFALTSLNDAALNSDNQTTKKDRHDFLALESVVKAALVRAIQVIENSPNLDALGPEIEDLIHYACELASLADFRAELEGWWFDRIAQAFSRGNGLVIPLVEVEARISYLREKYKISALQIDVESPAESPDSLDAYLFARQVLSVKSTEQRCVTRREIFSKLARSDRNGFERRRLIRLNSINTIKIWRKGGLLNRQ